jgi:hypothetical protein
MVKTEPAIMFGKDHAKCRHGRACHPFDVNDGRMMGITSENSEIDAV